MIRSHFARLVVGAALGATVLATVPMTPAYADTADQLQAQLDQANAHLSDLYAQAAEVNEQVNQTQDELDATNAEIEQKQQELSAAQDTLASRVTANYKTGGVSLLSIFFDSSSFEDLVNRIYYASKVSDSDAEVIENVKNIQSDLESKRSEQEQLLSDKQSQQDELNSKVSEAQNYVSSLDQQVQDKIAEERAAYEAEQAAAQAEAQKQAANDGGYVDADSVTEPVVTPSTNNTTNNGGSTNTNNGGSSNTNNNSGSSSKPSNNNSSNNSNSSNSSSASGLTASQRNAIVSAAWAKVGCAYVYGATGPSSYDCSGFVQYCYRAAGISLPRSSYSQGAWGRTTSNPQAGDIVCWGGHVGIYIGGGMMIDAGNESVGVSYRAVYGSPWYQTK